MAVGPTVEDSKVFPGHKWAMDGPEDAEPRPRWIYLVTAWTGPTARQNPACIDGAEEVDSLVIHRLSLA